MEKINEAGAAPGSPKFTPGPWVVVDRVFEDDRYYIVPRAAFEPDAERFKYFDAAAQIASLYVPHAMRQEPYVANARLIAAAPDLYRALRRFVAADYEPPAAADTITLSITMTPAEYRDARAALAKVEDRPSILGAAPGDSK